MQRRVRPLSIALVALTLLLVRPARDPHAQGAPRVTAAPRARGPRPPAHGTPLADSDRIPVHDSPVDGPGDALVTVVEFGDARDFFTARAETMLAGLRARYGDDVRVVWKTHPHAMLDPNGERTADALMAAHAQGRFWQLLAWFEAHQSASTDAEFTAGARAAGLDIERFGRDLAGHAQHAAVEADTRLARSLGGPDITPIFYVNGTRVVGAHALERFVPLIDAALAAARAVTPRERAYAESVRTPPVDPEGTPVPAATESHTVDLALRYRVSAEHAPTWGRADAPVTLVAFEDFECPACAQVEPVMAALRQRFPDDLRIVWRNLPLWVHPNAGLAAEAGLVVFALGGNDAFWRFHDALYSRAGHEGWLARGALEAAAAPLGIDMTRFRAMLDAGQTRGAVHDDALLAALLGIRATPGFFINGRMLTGVQPVERFARIIEHARGEARALIARGVAAADVYDQLTRDGATRVRYLALAPGNAPGEHDPRYVLPDDPGAAVRGPERAPVTIVWYGEYESLASPRVAQAIQSVMQRHPNQIRLEWRDLPPAGRPAATAIAEAGREVLAQRRSEGFWRFHATLLANQRALAPADLERYAAALHVNMPRFRAAMTGHTHEPEIRRGREGLDDLALRADAPVLFVQGRMMTGAALTDEAIERVVSAALH